MAQRAVVDSCPVSCPVRLSARLRCGLIPLSRRISLKMLRRGGLSRSALTGVRPANASQYALAQSSRRAGGSLMAETSDRARFQVPGVPESSRANRALGHTLLAEEPVLLRRRVSTTRRGWRCIQSYVSLWCRSSKTGVLAPCCFLRFQFLDLLRLVSNESVEPGVLGPASTKGPRHRDGDSWG